MSTTYYGLVFEAVTASGSTVSLKRARAGEGWIVINETDKTMTFVHDPKYLWKLADVPVTA